MCVFLGPSYCSEEMLSLNLLQFYSCLFSHCDHTMQVAQLNEDLLSIL
jgi:hypothetical protein